MGISLIQTPPSDFAAWSDNAKDIFWMQQALVLAAQAEAEGEVPVGAVLVSDDKFIASGWNQVIQNHDPTAHAEMQTLRQAGQRIQNYRLLNTTLYVTLEPCGMCAMAMVHARIQRLVFGTPDPKTGVICSQMCFFSQSFLNHRPSVTSGVLQADCSHQLSHFFQKRRKAHKQAKKNRASLA